MNQNSEKKPNNSKVAIRGAEAIPVADLVGYLALAFKLENVGVLLGAGASVCVGGRTMQEIWRGLRKEKPDLTRWLVAEHYVHEDCNTPRVVDGKETDDSVKIPNLEEVLSALSLAEFDSLRRKTDASEIVANASVIRAAVVEAARLNSELWRATGTDRAEELLTHHLGLLARLQGSRQPGQSAPWVFTTNYDLSIEWAAEALGIHVVNGFTGLHRRQFQANAFDLSLQNAQAIGEARFGAYNINLVKLHGSLSWQSQLNERDVSEVPAEMAGRLIDAVIGGDEDSSRIMMIQPTSAKYLDTVGFIYGELIRRMNEFLSRPNTVLVISGYGFWDAHVNRLIASGLQNPTLQLVIYYPSWMNEDQSIPNPFLERIRKRGMPRVVVVGGGKEAASFESMVSDLPDPAMSDGLTKEAKRFLNELAKNINSEPKD